MPTQRAKALKHNNPKTPHCGVLLFRGSDVDEKQQLVAHGSDFWLHREFWTVTSLLWLGLVAKTLKSDEQIHFRKFAAEVITAFLVAVAMFFAGLLNGLSVTQFVLLGVLGAVGTVRLLQWILQAVALIKSSGG